MCSADHLILEFDLALRTVFATARSVRPLPMADSSDAEMSSAEKSHACNLMRVNHCGEICAQALYQGQSLSSQGRGVSEALREAAREETDHLAWTERRIVELGGRKSLLNPLLYLGSLSLGVAAGLFGDRWNLGFLAETERQVEAHLEGHLDSLPRQDRRSRQIVEQMRVDEIRHAETALNLGAAELPLTVRSVMKFAAKIMTATTYHL